jgi:hypothetical protein
VFETFINQEGFRLQKPLSFPGVLQLVGTQQSSASPIDGEGRCETKRKQQAVKFSVRNRRLERICIIGYYEYNAYLCGTKGSKM